MQRFVKFTNGTASLTEIVQFINAQYKNELNLLKEENLVEVSSVDGEIKSKVYAVVLQKQIHIVVVSDGGLDLYIL